MHLISKFPLYGIERDKFVNKAAGQMHRASKEVQHMRDMELFLMTFRNNRDLLQREGQPVSAALQRDCLKEAASHVSQLNSTHAAWEQSWAMDPDIDVGVKVQSLYDSMLVTVTNWSEKERPARREGQQQQQQQARSAQTQQHQQQQSKGDRSGAKKSGKAQQQQQRPQQQQQQQAAKGSAKPPCDFCGKPGHSADGCFCNPASKRYRGWQLAAPPGSAAAAVTAPPAAQTSATAATSSNAPAAASSSFLAGARSLATAGTDANHTLATALGQLFLTRLTHSNRCTISRRDVREQFGTGSPGRDVVKRPSSTVDVNTAMGSTATNTGARVEVEASQAHPDALALEGLLILLLQAGLSKRGASTSIDSMMTSSARS